MRNENKIEQQMLSSKPRGVFKTRIQPIKCLKSGVFFGGEILSRLDGVADVELFFSCMQDETMADLVKMQVHMLNDAKFYANGEYFQSRYFINIRAELLCDFDFILWICNNSYVPLSLEVDFQELISNKANYFNKHSIQLLKDNGHNLWLDDFTCNFNQRSVELLSVIDWDGIKIDKSILWKLCFDESSLKHIVSCCRMFTDCVLMEGIETDHHLKICERAGLDYGQGFHWSDLQLS
ncbi:EAL domain-containing protein [Aeromonas piscicola]